jgi:hypothetical protein
MISQQPRGSLLICTLLIRRHEHGGCFVLQRRLLMNEDNCSGCPTSLELLEVHWSFNRARG